MLTKVKLIISLMLVAVVVTACQQSILPAPTPTSTETLTPTSTTTLTPSPTATPTPIVLGPTGFPEDIDPLTGLVPQDPGLLNRIPIAVKVSNYPRSGRPHAGLSFADIVYEYTIGEGANRFLAIYYGQDSSQVGPIRSGRLVDARLVPMYHAALVYSGAWWYVDGKLIDVLGGKLFIDGPYSCPAVCNDGRHEVTSVFANTAEVTKLVISRQIDNSRQPLDGMSFDSRLPQTGDPAVQLSVNFGIQNQGDWRYDPQSGQYLRWIEDVDADKKMTMIPLVDRVTAEQLAFANVIVMFAEHIKDEGNIDIVVNGNNAHGSAYLFRDGKVIKGTWRSTGLSSQLRFLTTEDEPLALKPGNTWIVIAAKDSVFDQVEPGNWEMYFAGK